MKGKANRFLVLVGVSATAGESTILGSGSGGRLEARPTATDETP
jgi:hypothetical protein